MCAAESSEQVIWKSSRGEVVGEMGLDSASRSGVAGTVVRGHGSPGLRFGQKMTSWITSGAERRVA